MSPPQDHHLTDTVSGCRGVGQANGSQQYSLCLFQSSRACVSFRSKKKTALMVSVPLPCPRLDFTPLIILLFAPQPLTTPAGGSIDFIFCHRTGASTQHQAAKLPGRQAWLPS